MTSERGPGHRPILSSQCRPRIPAMHETPLRYLSATDVQAALPDVEERLGLAERTMLGLGAGAQLPPKIGVGACPSRLVRACHARLPARPGGRWLGRPAGHEVGGGLPGQRRGRPRRDQWPDHPERREDRPSARHRRCRLAHGASHGRHQRPGHPALGTPIGERATGGARRGWRPGPQPPARPGPPAAGRPGRAPRPGPGSGGGAGARPGEPGIGTRAASRACAPSTTRSKPSPARTWC